MLKRAQIQPLGGPHDGPDIAGIILCLCPNYHVLLDEIAFWINYDLLIQGGEAGDLNVVPQRPIPPTFLQYQRRTHTNRMSARASDRMQPII